MYLFSIFKISRLLKATLPVLAIIGITACSTTDTLIPPGDSPEILSSTLPFQKADAPTFYRKAISNDGMVVSAHPLGSEAGTRMLQKGGNAIDAAVATAFAIAVLEPNMSGLGGSGAMTLWNREIQQANYLDFYAAAGANPDYALDTDPDSLITRERGVAVPGMVAGLLEALDKYGTLDRKTVLEPAIQLAREGFIIHHLLASVFNNYTGRLIHDDESKALFLPDGKPLRAGQLLVQPQLADVLEAIAREGRDAFYSGPIAKRTLERLAKGNSVLTLEDFENYTPKWRGALCEEWNGYRILTAPPTLAGQEVILALKLIERSNIAQKGHPVSSGEALGVMADALRIARADRNKWQGDPSFVGLPVAGMISNEYASLRHTLVGAEVPDTMHAGDPWIANQRYTCSGSCMGTGFFSLSPDAVFRDEDSLRRHIPGTKNEDKKERSSEPVEEQHTTHISVVDAQGNAVSMTNTLGLYFGSAVFSDGIFYNSAAHNFGAGYGSIRGPKRTAHSSTAPTIVLKGDDVSLVAGSPGSGRIPPAIVHIIVHSLIYDLNPYDAIRMPRIFPMIDGRSVQAELGFSAEALHGLHERGYEIDPTPYPMNMLFGGTQIIRVLDDGTLIGVSDPRRDGLPAGL